MVGLTLLERGLIYKPRLLAITLIVIIALGLFLQSLDWGSSLISISPLSFIPDVFADHGKEIILSLNDTLFAQKSPEEENQVKVIVNYATQDPMAVNDLVKGVMKVYSPNGTLLKTSSSPTPFPVSTSGKAQLATTLTDHSQDSVTAKVVFTNPIKTETVSNELLVKIDLIQGTPPATPDEKQIATEAVQNKEPVATTLIQKENETVSEQDKLVSSQEEESQPEEQQPITPQPIRPTGPLFPGAPHTFTSETANPSVIEICGDALDNDADALTDFKDGDCLVMASPSAQPPQEEQLTGTAAASAEVCDDTLDNDLDAKIDSEDEECISIAPLNQQLKSSSQEGQEIENSNSNNDNDNNEEQPASDEEDEDDNDENED